MARILRRWAKANGKHRKIRTTLTDIDQRTGEITERRSSRWHGPFVRRGAGFVSVNDGVAFAEQLLAAVEGRPLSPGGSPDAAAAAAVASIEHRRRRTEDYYRALGIAAA